MPKRFYRWNQRLKDRREARASQARAARKEEIQNAAIQAAEAAEAAKDNILTGSVSISEAVSGKKEKGVGKDGEQPVDNTSSGVPQRSCLSSSPRTRSNKGLTVNFNSLISSMSIFMMVNFALLNLLGLSSFSNPNIIIGDKS